VDCPAVTAEYIGLGAVYNFKTGGFGQGGKSGKAVIGTGQDAAIRRRLFQGFHHLLDHGPFPKGKQGFLGKP
jgi:hypothetical protein